MILRGINHEKPNKDHHCYAATYSRLCNRAYFLVIFGGQEPLPDGLIQANGRIEGDHYTVASKFPGRLSERTVSEGGGVNKGQILAKLDDAQVQAQVEQAKATVKSLEAQLAAARTGLAMLKKVVPLKVESAKAEINYAEARLEAARARGNQACKEGSRRAELLASQSI